MSESKCKELREMVGVEQCNNLTDKDLERFLVARNHVVPKAKAMVEGYLKYYNDPIKGMGDATPAHILDVPETAEKLHIWKTHFPAVIRALLQVTRDRITEECSVATVSKPMSSLCASVCFE